MRRLLWGVAAAVLEIAFAFTILVSVPFLFVWAVLGVAREERERRTAQK